MAIPDRRRQYAIVFVYATLALAWVAFARWVVPPLLLAESPGPTIAALKRLIRGLPALFRTSDILGCWSEFSGAVLIAWFLHMSISWFLYREFPTMSWSRSSTEVRLDRLCRFFLLFLSLVFLAITVVYGACHDYYFYLNMWYEVRAGHDPWFKVHGGNGVVPLNAYGPLFNLLAGLAWVNPLAPKLLFAYAYILFALVQTREGMRVGAASLLRLAVLTALFWNPFPWVEIANRGHFDILVGLLCLGTVRAWSQGYDLRAGICLAMGVLLKFIPVVMLPVFAFDHRRLRVRFLEVAIALIALGMAASCYWWGMSTLSPLMLAANRRSTALSIFRFIRGQRSPLAWFGLGGNYDFLAPIVMFLALLRGWWWSWSRQADPLASAVVAATTTVLFYHTGFPQYQMVPFALGAAWAIRNWASIRPHPLRLSAISGYFAWLAVFDFYYSFVDDEGSAYYWLFIQDAVGLPSFLIGWAFLVSVVGTEDEASRLRMNAMDGKTPGPGNVAIPPA